MHGVDPETERLRRQCVPSLRATPPRQCWHVSQVVIKVLTKPDHVSLDSKRGLHMGLQGANQFAQIFTTDSFSEFIPIWSVLFERFKPQKILEIGSFEGRSACFTIEEATKHADVELHCMDSFAGSYEHQHEGLDLSHLEARFESNTKVSLGRIAGQGKCRLLKHRTLSLPGLARLVTEGFSGYFDMIYVDANHLAHDVLNDLVLSFELLKTGGLMVADDYLWNERNRGTVLHNVSHPKPAVDAFVNINNFRIQILQASNYQMYLVKLPE